MYFIDRFALRAGNEKGDDEADTVGCCSLRYEHVTLEPPRTVHFDFLGKDSIRYQNSVEVDEQVYKNLIIFKKEPKKDGDLLFDRLSTTLLNAHLKNYMEGLTAKVFRTFNASKTFWDELEKTPVEGTIAEKVLAYNRANRMVAILCNHQRTVSKAHGSQVGKIQDKIRGIKYERSLAKAELLEMEPKLKRSNPDLVAEESDIDDDFISRYLEEQEKKEEEKIKKQLEKTNEKRKEEGLSPLKQPEKVKKERGSRSAETLRKKIEDYTKKIAAAKMQLIEKVETSNSFN
ncbi:DNA topoisomerase 1 [Irineochytrium annulatum]|nr:DNA topoisomerase 1 [Irineochytrium annulatum]